MEQYKQTNIEGNVKVTQPQQVTTSTSNEVKLANLEKQVSSQQRSILKLTREVARLRNDISDIIEVVNNRG